MTATPHTPAARCEAADQLRRAAYALQQMTGSNVFDLGALKNMLTPVDCPDHDHDPAGPVRSVSVPTSSSPIRLDYYRPPFIGRAA